MNLGMGSIHGGPEYLKTSKRMGVQGTVLLLESILIKNPHNLPQEGKNDHK